MAIGAILGAAISAIPAIMQTVEGTRQRRQGKQGLESLERPTYQIPEALQRATQLSQQAYADPYMPGENRMLDQAGLSASNALQASILAGDGQGAITGIQANQQAAQQQIGVASAQRQLQDMTNLQQMLTMLSQAQDTQFQMNEFAPFAEQQQEYRDMFGAGMKNQFAGVKNFSNVASAFLAGLDSDYDQTTDSNEKKKKKNKGNSKQE